MPFNDDYNFVFCHQQQKSQQARRYRCYFLLLSNRLAAIQISYRQNLGIWSHFFLSVNFTNRVLEIETQPADCVNE